MSSSIRRSDPGVRARLGVLAMALALLVGVHAGLEATSRYAEGRLDAFLWKPQNHLTLFQASNHVGRGADRVLILGPSEAREALLPEELAPSLDGLRPYQNAQSTGTLEDGLLVLQYIERAYGPSAIPRAILLGVTTRFVADIYVQPSPLQTGMALYSPHFRLEGEDHPPALVPRPFVDSMRARSRLLALQPDRYRHGLRAIAGVALTRLVPALAREPWTWQAVRPAKYLTKPRPARNVERWLTAPGNFWEEVHDWDPEASRHRVTRELGMLMDFVARYDITLYVVNMPERSANRALYKPGRYEAYLAILTEAIGPTPFLDLRTFLSDEDYFDDSHPLWPGGIRVSRRVAAFIREHRDRASASGSVR